MAVQPIRLQIRGDTEAHWQAVNPLLMDREIGLAFQADGTARMKVGTPALAHWNDLPYSFDAAGIQAEVSAITAQLATVVGDLTATNAAVAANTASIVTLTDSVANLHGDVTALQSALTGLNVTVTNLDGQVSTLADTVAGLGTRVTALESRPAYDPARDDAQDSQIAGIQANMSGLSASVTAMNGTIDTFNTRLTGDEASIVTLTGRADSADSRIGAIDTNINSLSTQVQTLGNEISDLADSSAEVLDYAAGAAYAYGTLVKYQGYIYRALEAIGSAPPALDPTKWEVAAKVPSTDYVASGSGTLTARLDGMDASLASEAATRQAADEALDAAKQPKPPMIQVGNLYLVKDGNDGGGYQLFIATEVLAGDGIRLTGTNAQPVVNVRLSASPGNALTILPDGLYFSLSGEPTNLPVGAACPYSYSLPTPTGFLKCDGASVSKTAYPELYAVIGDTFGNVDADHFNMPDMTGQIMFTTSSVVSVPVGLIYYWPAWVALPSGFIRCDGTSYQTAALPALYAVIGATFGGGDGYFNVPDISDAIIRSFDTASNQIPAGGLLGWPDAVDVPGGFLRCDGASYSTADYAGLFAVIGVTYGSEDASHFNVPSLDNQIIKW